MLAGEISDAGGMDLVRAGKALRCRGEKSPWGLRELSVVEGKKESWCLEDKAFAGRRRNPR